MSFLDKLEVLNVVPELELTVVVEEGILSLVLDFQVCRVGVVPVVRKVDTKLVDKRLLVCWLVVTVIVPTGMLTITFLSKRIKSLSA